MNLLEGLEMPVEQIHRKTLLEVWKKLSKKPFPKVKMLRLNDKDFSHVLLQRRCLEDDLREIEEWGRILPTKCTDACIFNAEEDDNVDYIIIVRKNPYHNLDEIILHELGHIARGDI